MVRRASTKMRGGNVEEEEKDVKPMSDAEINRAANANAGSRKEKDFLKDQMTYQRDQDQNASATSIKEDPDK